MTKYHFTCNKGSNGYYYGECIELEGCVTQGKTMQEYKKNCQEALDLYLQDVIEVSPSVPFATA